MTVQDDALANIHLRFEKPASLLTLLVQSMIFEQYLKNQSATPDWFPPYLREKESTVSNFMVAWAAALKADLQKSENRPDLDTNTFYQNYLNRPGLPASEKRLIEILFRYSLSDATLRFQKATMNLELTRLTSTEKVLRLLRYAKILAPTDRDFLKVAESFGASFAKSNDPEVAQVSRELLLIVLKRTEQLQSFQVEGPEALLGAAGLLRGAMILAAQRLGAFSSLMAWMSAPAATVTVGAAASGTVHGVALAVIVTRPSAQEKALALARESQRVEAQRLRIVNEKSSTADRLPAKPDRNRGLVYDSSDMLVRKAMNVLKSPESSFNASAYADLIASGEYEYRFSHQLLGPEAKSGLAVLSKVVDSGLITPLSVRMFFDRKTAEFDRYMASRNLKTLDSEAIVYLRDLETDLVANYETDESFSLPLFSSSTAKGNCVSRMLIHTAFFYPLFMKYKPRNLEYGLFLLANHVEAVLRNSDSGQVLVVQTLDDWRKAKTIDPKNPKVPISVDATFFSPKVLPAAYLLKRHNQVAFNLGDVVLRFGRYTSYVVDRYTQYIANPCRVAGCKLQELIIKIDQYMNYNPFTSTFLHDPIFLLLSNDTESIVLDGNFPPSSKEFLAKGGSIAKTEAVLENIPGAASEEETERVSSTTKYMALQRTEKFFAGFAPSSVPSPKVENSKDECFEFGEGLGICAFNIPQYLSFPVTTSRFGIHVLTDNGKISDLPFNDVKGFVHFFRWQVKQFLQSRAYLDLKSALKRGVYDGPGLTVESTLSTLNLFGSYRQILHYEGLNLILAQLEGTPELAALKQERESFRKTLLPILEDSSGTKLKQFFETQNFRSANVVLKMNVALQAWHSTLTPTDFEKLTRLVKRVDLSIKKMSPEKASLQQSTLERQPRPNQNDSNQNILWIMNSDLKAQPVPPQLMKQQLKSANVEKTDKITIQLDSLSGLFFVTTLGGAMDGSRINATIADLKIDDISLAASRIGQRLATLSLHRSLVAEWFGNWIFTASQCDRHDKTPQCVNSTKIVDGLFSHMK